MKTIVLRRRLGIILAMTQLLITLVFLGFIMILNIIPFNYMMLISSLLLLLSVFTIFTQISGKSSTIGKIIAILSCVILVIGVIYLIKLQSMFHSISSAGTKVEDVAVVVLESNSAQSIEDVSSYTFGIQETIDRDNTDKIIQTIQKDLGIKIKTVSFDNFDAQVEALYLGKTKAIIINQACREMITEIYDDFDDMTKVLVEKKIEKEVEIKKNDKKVNKEPFTMYISGIDTYGSISTTSRSDVNIIATINPNTKQILLTTTPRDYYVPFPISNGVSDKLTHAGIYGAEVSVKTLEDLYDITIDYYVRINFTSLIEIVDALGGVTVDSEYEFNVGTYSFTQGENQLQGEAALAFVRERHAFAQGDNQRGENQMQIIKAMLMKAASPTMIQNAGSIMDSISNSIETNMRQSEITNLIKMHINEGGDWGIILNSVTGTGDRRTTYSYRKRELYVMIPDEKTVEMAKSKMKQVMGNIAIE